MDEIQGETIGIDLGTTYSCVGIWENDRVEIIANDQGNRTTPSWVAFQETEKLIGEAAKNQYNKNPENTIFDIKRFMGQKYTDPNVQAELKHMSFKMKSGKNQLPVVCIRDKEFTPQEISAFILEKMKKIAILATGWHFSSHFYEHMPKQIIPEGWEVDYFCIAHRKPEDKNTKAYEGYFRLW